MANEDPPKSQQLNNSNFERASQWSDGFSRPDGTRITSVHLVGDASPVTAIGLGSCCEVWSRATAYDPMEEGAHVIAGQLQGR